MAVLQIPGLELGTAGKLLGTALAIYLFAVAVGRLCKKVTGVRLGVVYQLFCLALALYSAATIFSPQWTVIRDLAAVTILTGTAVAVRVIDQFFWRWFFEQRRKVPIPKFIREVVTALLLLIAFLLVLDLDYGVHVPGLLAASGIVGIILGFALQDSLGNIIAGFALQIGRPFTVGDWLLVENQHVQAVEINWRSTRFVTNDEVQLDVPNQHIVKQVITNYHGGGSRHAMRLEVGIDYDAPPNRVKDLLTRAAAATRGVLHEPPPAAFLKSFGDSAINYEVRFWLNDHHLYNTIADGIRTNIWYALRRQSIKIPFPMRTLHVERPHVAQHEARQERHAATLELLQSQPLFQGMEKDHLEYLIKRSHMHHYGRGETIIHEGAEGASMFLLLQGEASVIIRGGVDSTTVVASLHKGECFGEMSLLTGEKRRASVMASHDAEVLEVTKPIFAHLIQKDEGLLPRLSALLARRQLETEGVVQSRKAQPAAVAAIQERYQAGFLNKLRSFFEV